MVPGRTRSSTSYLRPGPFRRKTESTSVHTLASSPTSRRCSGAPGQAVTARVGVREGSGVAVMITTRAVGVFFCGVQVGAADIDGRVGSGVCAVYASQGSVGDENPALTPEREFSPPPASPINQITPATSTTSSAAPTAQGSHFARAGTGAGTGGGNAAGTPANGSGIYVPHCAQYRLSPGEDARSSGSKPPLEDEPAAARRPLNRDILSEARHPASSICPFLPFL